MLDYAMKRFFANKFAVLGLSVIVILILTAIFAPIICRFDPLEINLENKLLAPNSTYWFGTDELGRDIFSRMVYGTRVSITIGLISMGIASLLGIIIGSIAGYFGGKVDLLIMRVIEVVMCFPFMFLLLALIAYLPQSIYTIMVVIGLTRWTGIARLIRGQFIALREREFVMAARTIGASNLRIIFRHILPNAITPVLISITFGIAGAILAESGLSFLGFGVPVPQPSWGNILASGREYIDLAWWLMFYPGLAIFITVTCYNLVGEALRDALDPRLR
ncbi:MAG: peptide ABC transporter permease [Candidatus Muiribacterium halophilum]|uniref:Peptide ABC transporter permease n=1 Tax=Muiribacterium halophilum TaxID=2053465 RepID=A0A2N5ZN26_MUIH1|nr:MAG: peptide ABC transporter permease [Candidatus Muirbacterium halophilum]